MRVGSMLLALTLAVSVRAHAAAHIEPRRAQLPGQLPAVVWPRVQSSLAAPGRTKLVTFVYDQNDTYTILCLPGAVTDIELRPNEQIAALALGDSIRWQAEKKGAHLFLRPLRAGLFTSATLVTTERTYEMTLDSVDPGGTWYQRVNWSYPNLIVLEENQAAAERASAKSTAQARLRSQASVRAPLETVSLANLHFGYEISGDAPFRPSQVFDDGTFTYIRFARKPQELPALFIETPDGRDELAVYNFEPRDPTAPNSPMIKVHRLFDVAVLKLGGGEVRITRTR